MFELFSEYTPEQALIEYTEIKKNEKRYAKYGKFAGISMGVLLMLLGVFAGEPIMIVAMALMIPLLWWIYAKMGTWAAWSIYWAEQRGMGLLVGLTTCLYIGASLKRKYRKFAQKYKNT